MSLTSLQAARYASDVYDKVERKKCCQESQEFSNRDFNKISTNYIRSTIGYPKKDFDINSIKTKVLFKTEAGVEAFVTIKNQKLIITIAGTNSLGDWLFNLQYVVRVLRQELFRFFGFKDLKGFKGYKLAYQTLGGYILHYINTYEDLSREGIVKPINSAAIIGHSAGGMIANHLANAVNTYFSKTIGFYTQLFTFAAPVIYESEPDTDRLEINRFVIKNDLVSQSLPFLLRKEQKFTTILPAIAMFKRPHQMENFIQALEEEDLIVI